MSRIAYVNGRYVPISQPSVEVEDRGLQFADSVYEVILVSGGKPVDEEPHLDRLERSMGEIHLAPAMSRRALKLILRRVLRRNRINDGMLYLQVTRGAAPRNPAFPSDTRPSLIVTARRLAPMNPKDLAEGVAVTALPDLRWKRCDIKSVALLPNILAKQQALDAGFFDAWLVGEDGLVTEGSASNAWIVTADGDLVTRPASPAILRGVTRMTAIRLAGELKIPFVERPFSLAEAKAAREAFLTSASATVLPVVCIDEAVIGDGRAGPLTMALIKRYRAYLSKDAAAGKAGAA
ncbi:MAG: D-amino-acid transaminase [Rhodospirillales bacterium]|jgi:D-alanine transaminase|nr:D-amino-acid transaminase [Rhodospirillales bacterium]MDP7651409.1 D-amino-acid transaminase [Rhodospirillales bacterium]